jgi:hypothetical protein
VRERERPEWETRVLRRERKDEGSTARWAKVVRGEWRGTARMAWLRKGDEASRDDKKRWGVLRRIQVMIVMMRVDNRFTTRGE